MSDDLRESYHKIGHGLAEIVAKISLTLYQKDDFRELISFEEISRPEQERIFNELQVSFLGLMVLYLENLESDLKEQLVLNNTNLSISKINESLISGFLEIYREIGIDEKFVKMWEALIEMRLTEYRNDYKIALKESKNLPNFKKGDERLAVRWARTETLTIDCATHIRKGKFPLKDPLRKCLMEWFINTESIFADTIKTAIFEPKAES